MKLRALWDDVISSFRRTIRRPRTFGVLAITAAAALGSVTGTFDVAYNLLHGPLPYEHAAAVVVASRRTSGFLVSPYNWRANPSAGQVFQGLTEFHLQTAIFDAPSGPRHLLVACVAPHFFSVLGIRMALGNGLSAAPVSPAREETAWLPLVLSHRLWRESFHSDPGIVGREIDLKLLAPNHFLVVGVAPAGAEFPHGAAAWTPEHLTSSPVAQSASAPSFAKTSVGQLRAGFGVRQAEAAIRTWPRTDPTWVWNRSADLVPLREFVGGGLYLLAPWLWLITAVFLVLTVAAAVGICRGDFEERRDEFRIRGWLGCSGRRMLRGRGLEVGGALGLGLGGGVLVRWIVVRATARLLGVSPATTARAVGLELLMALAASGFAALLILLPEARRLGRLHLPGASSPRMGFGFPVQIFTATVILATAVFAFRGAYGLAHIDPGVRPRGVYVADVTLPLSEDNYVDANPDATNASALGMRERAHLREALAARFNEMIHFDFSRMAASLRGRAGVTGVGVTGLAPYSGYAQGGEEFWVSPTEGHGSGSRVFSAHMVSMGPGAIGALGMKLLFGRNFRGSDHNAVIVSQTLARSIAAGAGSLGRFVIPPALPAARIIGIVADVHGRDLLTAPEPTVYFPLSYFANSDADVVIRTSKHLSLKDAEALVQGAASSIVPGSTVTRVQTLGAMVASAGKLTRYCEHLVLWLAGLGIFLVGVCAWAGASGQVRRREHEIGVRLALGARERQLAMLILGGQLGQSLGAACLGGMAAWWLSQAALHLLPGVVPAVGSSLMSVVGIELLVLAVAIWAFRRAIRRAPSELLSTLRP